MYENRMGMKGQNTTCGRREERIDKKGNIGVKNGVNME